MTVITFGLTVSPLAPLPPFSVAPWRFGRTWAILDVTGGSNATFPILFGDFQRAYTLADRSDTRITVDSNITAPGYIKYYVRKRVHGSLMNVDALKALKTAA